VDQLEASIVDYKAKMNKKLKAQIRDWNDPLKSRTMGDADELIDALRIELAGKESVIKVLHDDIREYRKDWEDQMIQDQGIDKSA